MVERPEPRAFEVGFQGSETDRCEVIVYTGGPERGMDRPRAGEIRFEGVTDRDDAPALVACETSKKMGAAAGKFSFKAKLKKSDEVDFRNLLAEDDWVDLIFTKFDRRHHVMRGLIDDVRKEESVTDGATTITYVVSGRDFGKIFEVTPIWFDRVTENEFTGGAANRLSFLETDNPADTVFKILVGFLQEQQEKGRANWELPNMPGITSGTFVDSVFFHDSDFRNVPNRSSAINPNYFSPYRNYVWPLAVAWSDAPLCELYVDLARGGSLRNYYLEEDEEADRDQTAMAVYFRDRPYPTFEKEEQIEDGPYFKRLPVFTVPPQAIESSSIGRGGIERYNGYFVAPKLYGGEAGSALLDMQVPLINDEDILRHGFRRMDIVTRYIARAATEPLGFTSRKYRRMIRDYHCMNHLLYNGRFQMHGRPDIRIGGRLRIPQTTPEETETYYIEGVSHRWDFRSGIRTGVDVTRGFVGTDTQLVSTLEEIIDQYTTAVPSGA